MRISVSRDAPTPVLRNDRSMEASGVLASFIEFVARPGATRGGKKNGPARTPLLWTPAPSSEPSSDNWLEPRLGAAATPFAQIDLDGGQVELYATSATSGRGEDCAERILSKSDWLEIDRVRHASARAQLIAARIALRRALTRAACNEIPPSAWQFARTPFGRPYIEPGLPQLHFSVSHSEGLSVIAVSRDRPVGIDIEAEEASTDDDFVRAFLSRRERSAIRGLPQVRRPQAIIELWSLKEAYAKMLGTGLAADFKSFEFHLDPARLMSHCEAADGSQRTRFRTWRVPGPGGLRRMALAVGQRSPCRLH